MRRGRTLMAVAMGVALAAALSSVGEAAARPGWPNPEAGAGYWPLDGTAVDASGHGHDGVIHGAVPIADGIRGGAFRFDGDDWIDVGRLNSVFADGTYTVSLWARTDRPRYADDYRMMVGKIDDASGTGPLHMALGTEPGSCRDSPYLQIWQSWRTLDNPPICNLGVNVRDGAWHMVTVTVTPQRRALYVDGTLIAERRGAIHVPQARQTPISIGGMEFGVNHRWIGDLDEIWVFPAAVSAAKVCALYQQVTGT